MNAPGYGLTDRARLVSITGATVAIDGRLYRFISKRFATGPCPVEPSHSTAILPFDGVEPAGELAKDLPAGNHSERG